MSRPSRWLLLTCFSLLNITCSTIKSHVYTVDLMVAVWRAVELEASLRNHCVSYFSAKDAEHPRPPGRGRLQGCRCSGRVCMISIHALRVEGDSRHDQTSCLQALIFYEYFTNPARQATHSFFRDALVALLFGANLSVFLCVPPARTTGSTGHPVPGRSLFPDARSSR